MAPVLEAGEAVFDPVALAVSGLVVRDQGLATFARRDARNDPFVFQGLTIPACVVAAIRPLVLGR